ncbi:MAG: hypothetical protein Q7U36_01300 [bacterium]|nr:hypothetical protein [bacterium]
MEKTKNTIEIAIAPGATLEFPNDNTPNPSEDEIGEATILVAVAPGVALEFPALDFLDEE